MTREILTGKEKVYKEFQKEFIVINSIIERQLAIGGATTMLQHPSRLAPFVTSEIERIIKELRGEGMMYNYFSSLFEKQKEKVGGRLELTALLSYRLFHYSEISLQTGLHPELFFEKLLLELYDIIQLWSSLVINENSLDDESLKLEMLVKDDKELRDSFMKAFKFCQDFSKIRIEASDKAEIEVKYNTGAYYEKGCFSAFPGVVGEQTLENVSVLLWAGEIERVEDLLNTMDFVRSLNRSLLVICFDISDECLELLKANHHALTLSCQAVRAPLLGEWATESLEDLALIVGGRCFSAEKGDRLNELNLSHLGHVSKAIVTEEDLTLIDANTPSLEKRELLESRKKSLYKLYTDQAARITSPSVLGDFEKKIEVRLGLMDDMSALLFVGAYTLPELRRRNILAENTLEELKETKEKNFTPSLFKVLESSLEMLKFKSLGSLGHSLESIAARKVLEQSFEYLSKLYSYDLRPDSSVEDYSALEYSLINAARISRQFLDSEVMIRC